MTDAKGETSFADSRPEHDLIAHLKERSPEAFEELVRRYAGRLYSVTMRILRSPHDAEDAVQETFLSAFQNIETFREEASLYTWLYRIAANQALAKLKYKDRHPAVPIEPYLPRFERGEHAEEVQDWSQIPDRELETRELENFFEQCIDELPDDLRIAYVLKDVEKLPEDDVSRILDVPKFTMKNRVHRARLVIRKRIENRFFKSAR